jgi:hypothetical protein
MFEKRNSLSAFPTIPVCDVKAIADGRQPVGAFS